MFKSSYIITLLGGLGLFNSCTANLINVQNFKQQTFVQEKQQINTILGNYLAGRVAHIRQDYDSAAKYYVKAMQQGLTDNELLEKTYMILAVKGDIDEAFKYANKAREQGDTNNFIDVIKGIYCFKHKEYKTARELINKINDKTYENIITPLFNAWSYAGEENYQKAIDSLNKIANVDEMKTVYLLHFGLINEHFNRNDIALKAYDEIIEDKSNDISFRALQIITNFYIRQDQKDKAKEIVSKHYGSSNVKEMLSSLRKKIENSDIKTKRIVDDANVGISEIFLEVALLFKTVPAGYDYAQMFMSFSQYFNQDNDIAKLALVDIFEERGMYEEANKYYDLIKENSEIYYPAQIKKANNLSAEKKYDMAERVLKNLLKDNPKNFQVLFNLGDVLRMSDNQSEAIKYYNKALKSVFYESEKHWPIYYALAVSYDRNNEWEKAENSLQKALKLSHRNPQVLNYLGYSWLKNKTDIDKAASFILEAYEKDPNDGVIIDSLGWVYFKTGDYQNAIVYLEKASELNPQNAVISDHLGDAYWFGGRKNEAVYLWKQALKQKEAQEELNIKSVKNKINNGLKKATIFAIKDESLKQNLQSLKDITE